MFAVSECPGQERAPCPGTAVDWGHQISKPLLHILHWPSPSADPEKGSSKYTIRFKNPKKPSACGPTETPVCSPDATQYSKRISHHIRRSHHPPLSGHLGFAKRVSLHKRPLPIHPQSPHVVVGALHSGKGIKRGLPRGPYLPAPIYLLTPNPHPLGGHPRGRPRVPEKQDM